MRADEREGFDPGCPATRADPFAHYRWLRRSAPAYRLPHLPMWVLSRYGDVDAALRDADTYSSDLAVPVPILSLILMDAPDHTRVRKTALRAFTWRSVQALAPRILEISEELVGNLDGPVDFADAFASPLPVTVICEILGIPCERRGDMKRWSRDALRSGVPTGGVSDPELLRDAQAGTVELLDFLRAEIDALRGQASPAPTLLGRMVALEREGVLRGDELLYFAALILIAGDETSANMFSAGAHILAERPGLWERLACAPHDVPRFVEEVLRFESPLQRVVRRTTRDVCVAGVDIPRSAWVMLLIGSANRDPERFPDPDVFDIDRETRGHLAFSGGVHSCMGASLARLEGRIGFEVLLRRLRGLELDRSRPPTSITDYGAGNFGWSALPLIADRRKRVGAAA